MKLIPISRCGPKASALSSTGCAEAWSDFSPILFEYRAINVQQHDQMVPTVVAEHIDEDREKEIRTHKREHEARLMFAMYHNPNGTLREWAMESGFTIKTGAPRRRAT